MDVLKRFSSDNIRRDLKIVKAGHIKRLQYAIKQLRTPTEEENEARKVNETIQNLNAPNLANNELPVNLMCETLNPFPDTFRIEGDLQGKLCKLRNSWLMILGVTNTLLLILITTLAAHLDLELLGTNPLGLLFLLVFGLVFAVQFVCMLLHRVHSLSHWLACAQCSCCTSQCSCCTRSRKEQSQRQNCDTRLCCCCPFLSRCDCSKWFPGHARTGAEGRDDDRERLLSNESC